MDRGRDVRNLALIGFMGVGKSSVGHMAAACLNFSLMDTDEWIERRVGKSVSSIFEQDGEAVFRQWEQAVVEEVDRSRELVIATGGGLGADVELLARLKAHALVVCLWASAEAIWERIRHQVHRPLLRTEDPQSRIAELLAVRAPVYRQADVLIHTEMRSVKEVTHQVLHQFQLARASSVS